MQDKPIEDEKDESDDKSNTRVRGRVKDLEDRIKKNEDIMESLNTRMAIGETRQNGVDGFLDGLKTKLFGDKKDDGSENFFDSIFDTERRERKKENEEG
jgi:hypothetical protein